MSAALLVLVMLGAWELYVRSDRIDELVLPAPTQIAESLWRDRALLAEDLLVTSGEILLGLTAAVALGIAVAVAMHLWPAVRAALHPLAIGSQAVPIPLVAPLLIFVLGFGLAPKVLVIALVCFFPVTINLYDGLRGADPDARKLFRSLDASRRQTLLLLEAPSALPSVFTGLKIAAAVSVIAAVFGEWIGSSAGLGYTLLTAGAQLAMDRAFAAAFLLFLLAIAMYAAFAALERRLIDWRPK